MNPLRSVVQEADSTSEPRVIPIDVPYPHGEIQVFEIDSTLADYDRWSNSTINLEYDHHSEDSDETLSIDLAAGMEVDRYIDLPDEQMVDGEEVLENRNADEPNDYIFRLRETPSPYMFEDEQLLPVDNEEIINPDSPNVDVFHLRHSPSPELSDDEHRLPVDDPFHEGDIIDSDDSNDQSASVQDEEIIVIDDNEECDIIFVDRYHENNLFVLDGLNEVITIPDDEIIPGEPDIMFVDEYHNNLGDLNDVIFIRDEADVIPDEADVMFVDEYILLD